MVFGLAESPPVVANARRYAEIVRTNATLRGLIRAGGQIAQLGYDRPGEVEDLVDQAQQVVYDLARHGDREDFAAIRELLADAFVRISELRPARAPAASPASRPASAISTASRRACSARTWSSWRRGRRWARRASR